eukprot:TRINITY_DN67936_c13_g1_i3.p1 TRINITY_DN67936_c13_g1~~TRINITY_DN67936_c13_g1_i3.p1  ORF type:complete len:563 (+),score=38.93 TRINITY_DN67936_c13_g1_i3:56-1744(+)
MDWIARVGTPETEEFRREEILRRLFVWWDIDGSGRIDQGEVEQVLVTFKNGKAEHVAALKQRWKGLLSGGTIPANGQMSESRFVHAFATLLADFSFSEFEAFLTHVEETLQFILSLTETNRRRLATCKLFAAWDSSGSGWLDSDEVERILLATPWGDENQQTISLLFERVYEAHQDKQKTEDVDLQEFGTIFKCLFRDCSEQQFNDICRQLRQAIKHDHDPDKHIVARFMSKKKARSRSPSPPLPSTQSAPDSTHTTSCTNVRSRSPTGGLLSAVMIPPPTSSSSSRSTSPYKYPPLSGGQSTSPSPPLTDSQQQYDDQYVIQQRIKALKQDIKHCFDGLSYDEVDACFVTGKSLPPYYEIVAAPVCLLLHISPRADKSGEVRYWSGLEGVLQSDYVNFLGLLHNYQDIPISNEMVMRLQAYCSEVSFSYNYLVGHQSHFLAALSKWLSTLVELTCLQHAWEYPPPSLPTDIRHLQHDDHPTTRLRANQLPPVPYNNTTNTPITQDHPPPPSRNKRLHPKTATTKTSVRTVELSDLIFMNSTVRFLVGPTCIGEPQLPKIGT